MKAGKQVILLLCFLMLLSVFGFCLEEDLYENYDFGERLGKLEVYFEAEMYEEAAQLLDELVVQFPSEPRFEYLKAIVDYQRQDYARAEKVFVEFIKRYPQIPEPYYLLAQIYWKMGNENLARKYIMKYNELTPENYNVHLGLNSTLNKESKETIIIRNGKEDLGFVKKIGFYGAGIHSYQEQSIKLINGSFRTRSSMGIDFVDPLDLRAKQIVIVIKGKQGGEKFMLTLRDKFSQDHNPQLVAIPKEAILSDWQQIKLSLEEQSSIIDLSQIVHLGLEFGFSTVHNPANSTLYVKDIFVEDAGN